MARDKYNPVDEESVAEALDRHVAALIKRRGGSDATPYKLNRRTAELFRLNRELYQAMVPVEPSEAFVDQLKSQLIAAHGEIRTRRIDQRASLVGSAMSFFTLAAFAFRVLASIVVIVALILSQRRRRSAAPA